MTTQTKPHGRPAKPASSAKPTAPSTLQQWFPAAVWLREYNWGKFTALDLIAAVSVAALLIPESMGYATVAGVPAQVGLYATPLALIGYALFGGSRLLMFGAAGSVAAVSASVVNGLHGNSQQAVEYTAVLALTAGVVFLVAGLARMGWISNFMSKAVMAGFITAMAISIIVGQLGKLTGVHAGSGDTFQKLWHVLSQIGSWNWTAVALGVGSLVLIFAIQRFTPKIPAALSAVVITSVIVAVFSPSIKLVAKIPTGLPKLVHVGGISSSDWVTLLLGGAVVALVGFSEGWGAGQTVSKKTHDEINANQEFRAYGIGELGAGLLGGMVCTGSLSKSSVAMSAGAKTQMTSVFLALLVLLVLLVLAPALQWLPETVLAAVVINAMSGSANPAKLTRIWNVDRVDFALGLIVGIIVLAWNLLPAMITGIILSVMYLVYKTSFPGGAVLGRIPATGDFETITWKLGHRMGPGNPNAQPVPGVIVYRFDSPLVFSNSEAFKDGGEKILIHAAADGTATSAVGKWPSGGLPHTLVIDCEEMFEVDTTGAAAVTSLLHYAQRFGVDLALARVHSDAREILKSAGVIDEVGEDHVYDTVRDAVDAVTNGHAQTPDG
jgi:sulfate permease, SulP family